MNLIKVTKLVNISQALDASQSDLQSRVLSHHATLPHDSREVGNREASLKVNSIMIL